ncbi:hypothetical protein P9B03_17255 [Metasolibacillus meyeri]|uniref:ComC/BlpC family peptide pheromone/bacteriocin n=1 Tax=Metasolibacillus meyeri TaxID=1071052 RepID=A0AAW9NWB3_9BACL|nr:hypothetical protein [Metasolibacillus meyeri]MEC1180254.1 hypothetical protein [Metasolibacillus meyeri]
MTSNNFSNFQELTDQDLLRVEGGGDIMTDVGYLVGRALGTIYSPRNLKNAILIHPPIFIPKP